jgi:hypothetical protein
MQEDDAGRKEEKEEDSGSREEKTQAQTVLTLLWAWTRLPNLYTAWMGPLVRVMYSGLT